MKRKEETKQEINQRNRKVSANTKCKNYEEYARN